MNLTVISSTFGYAATVMQDGPIAYWRLDEGNGRPRRLQATQSALVANDYVGNHNGVYTNADIGITPGYSAFDSDTAAGFGNIYVSSADSMWARLRAYNFVTPTNQNAAFSVEAWVQHPYATAQTINGAGIVANGYGGGGEQFALDCGGTSQ